MEGPVKEYSSSTDPSYKHERGHIRRGTKDLNSLAHFSPNGLTMSRVKRGKGVPVLREKLTKTDRDSASICLCLPRPQRFLDSLGELLWVQIILGKG